MSKLAIDTAQVAKALRGFAASAIELAEALDTFASAEPGTSVQKVEIVVTTTTEPDRIAREVKRMLEALKPHPPGAA